MKLMKESELERTLAAARGSAAPNAADRARVTSRLRSHLGADVVEGSSVLEGLRVMDSARVPEAPPGASEIAPAIRSASHLPRLTAIVSTGLVMGALGLVVGYGLGRRAAPIAAVSTHASPSPVTPTAAAAPSGSQAVVSLPNAPPDRPPLSPADTRAETVPVATPPRAPISPPPRMRGVQPPQRSADTSDPGHAKSSRAEAKLGFTAVVERLRDVNQSLNEGRAPLALIQLTELDRVAGSILEQERTVTRILTLCALGDTAGARRGAKALGKAATASIYAQRIADSCAGGSD